MNRNSSFGKRVLLCILTGVGFYLLTDLARLLGGLASGTRPVVNWLIPISQLPMPVVLLAVMLLTLLGARAGVLVMGVCCAVGAFLGGFAVNLPVDFSNGWPKNYHCGYLNGGMIELVFGIGAIVLAIVVQLFVNLIRRKKESKDIRQGDDSLS